MISLRRILNVLVWSVFVAFLVAVAAVRRFVTMVATAIAVVVIIFVIVISRG